MKPQTRDRKRRKQKQNSFLPDIENETVRKKHYERVGSVKRPPTGKHDLTDLEKQNFGDRKPKGYSKLRLLGKGGYALVWLLQDSQGNTFAGKQFPAKKKALDRSSDLEIEVQRRIKEFARSNPQHPGLAHISLLQHSVSDSKDTWLLYDVGGDSLTKALFTLKGEFYKGERVYGIRHSDLY